MKRFLMIFCVLFLFSPLIYGQRDSIYASISGDSVTIWNINLTENCFSKYIFSLQTPDSNKIVLHEIDTSSKIARCYCRFDLSFTLTGIKPGHYEVAIYRDYTPEKSDFGKDTSVFIGSAEFDIYLQSSAGLSHYSIQSPCGGFSGVAEEKKVPNQFYLGMNFPNPFNPTTTIHFELPKESNVTLKVYNLLGQEVMTLVDGKRTAGVYDVRVDGTKLGSGVYFYKLTAGAYAKTKKMISIK